MNYLKIYEKICERGKKVRTPDAYYEKHHIVPKCLGGVDCVENLTRLTFREHYLAHLLLAKAHPDNSKLQYSLNCMRRLRGGRVLTGAQYKVIKENQRKFMSKQWSISNPGQKEENRQKSRERLRLRPNPLKGKPEKNPNVCPIEIEYTNGQIVKLRYIKEGVKVLNIPYRTLWCLVKNGKPSKKHNIQKIHRR